MNFDKTTRKKPECPSNAEIATTDMIPAAGPMLCGVREACYTAERGEDIAAGYDFAPRCMREWRWLS